MKTLKEICKKNWYIIASTLLLFVCAEVLCGIMLCDQQYFNFGLYFSSEGIIVLVLRIVSLFAGVVITYFFVDIFKSKYSLVITFIFMVFAFIYREHELDLIFNYYTICFMAVMLSLAFYYVNYCADSIRHTLVYMVMTIVMWAIMFFETEIFVVLSVNIFLFITNKKSIRRKSLEAVNWIFAGVSSALFIIKSVVWMVSHMEYRYTDSETVFLSGTISGLEKMLITSKDFGTSEFFGEFADESVVYNLAKMFGYYGYSVGVAMIMLIVIFAASILIGCCKKQEKMTPALGAAAIILMVRIISALFINFGIITTAESYMPFITVLPCGNLIAGLVIGVIFAADKQAVLKENESNKMNI